MASNKLNDVTNSVMGWLGQKPAPAPSPEAQQSDQAAAACPTCGNQSMATDVKKSFNQKLNMPNSDDQSK